MRLARPAGLFLLLAVLASACSSSSPSSSTTPASQPARTTTTGATTAPTPANRPVCGNAGVPPAHYSSVVVFAFENRTWSAVGDGFGPAMPYLHQLGAQCSWFSDWTETNTSQSSLTQYVGQVTGAFQAQTVEDCSPAPGCSTTADNIFRQARRAGVRAIDYVEGATSPCSAEGNASKHVPPLYLWGADDRAHCGDQVRPFTEFDPNHLPAFAFVTPTPCNDGHDCPNATVDAWAAQHIAPVLASNAYRARKVAVFVWYDEDHPVPNMWITPTARAGAVEQSGAGYAGTLRAWEGMLGLPCLANACTTRADMRAAANS
jgi:phosphatidylinositol-3-phosphatase